MRRHITRKTGGKTPDLTSTAGCQPPQPDGAITNTASHCRHREFLDTAERSRTDLIPALCSAIPYRELLPIRTLSSAIFAAMQSPINTAPNTVPARKQTAPIIISYPSSSLRELYPHPFFGRKSHVQSFSCKGYARQEWMLTASDAAKKGLELSCYPWWVGCDRGMIPCLFRRFSLLIAIPMGGNAGGGSCR